MSNKTPVDIAASVLARLKNLTVQRGWNFMHMLTRYGIERFLFRLGASEYARQFVLKGGNMFVIWQNGNNSRPTIDSDLLCYGVVPVPRLRGIRQNEAGQHPPGSPSLLARRIWRNEAGQYPFWVCAACTTTWW